MAQPREKYKCVYDGPQFSMKIVYKPNLTMITIVCANCKWKHSFFQTSGSTDTEAMSFAIDHCKKHEGNTIKSALKLA